MSKHRLPERAPAEQPRAARASAGPTAPDEPRSLVELRYSGRPGGVIHWIPARLAAEAWAWETGVLLDVRDFEVLVEFPGLERPKRLGSLWTDALRSVAASRKAARDESGRPYVLWNAHYRILMFDQGGRNPIFNVVDLERSPEELATWERLAAADPEWARRPAPPGAAPGVWRAIYVVPPPRAGESAAGKRPAVPNPAVFQIGWPGGGRRQPGSASTGAGDGRGRGARS